MVQGLHSTRKLNRIYNVKFIMLNHMHHGRKVENVNMLIRQYVPKGFNINTISRQYLAYIQNKINSRPREKLMFKSPIFVFNLNSAALFLVRYFYILKWHFWDLSIDMGIFWGSWFLHSHEIPHPNQWGSMITTKKYCLFNEDFSVVGFICI